LFIFVALMIGISRVVVTAHYTSDVLFGAFVGTVTALWMYRYFYKSKSG
ncbi:MAG: phosphatase PAP2 family protein, partial [Deltaproteobacteria bacterium]|nr:phosphatase PAP2 family protein [Deltaproteobacteria bacterium]